MTTKVISLRVSPTLDRQLRVEAAKQDLDRSAAIRQAVEDWLSKVRSDADAPLIGIKAAQADADAGRRAQGVAR